MEYVDLSYLGNSDAQLDCYGIGESFVTILLQSFVKIFIVYLFFASFAVLVLSFIVVFLHLLKY